MKIGCIIQARTGSSRLAKKVLLNLPFDENITVLEQVIRRAKKSILLNAILIATTTSEDDNPICDIAKKENIKFYRGSETNVLERYYKTAVENNIDIIVRITSDCPCLDYNIINNLVKLHLKEKNDYSSNITKRTFPHGLDIEIFNFKVLEEAYKNSTKDYEKEHVTTYIYYSNPNKFKIGSLISNKNDDSKDIRITLDTEKDYAVLCLIYDSLYKNNNYFTYENIIDLYKEKPWIKLINNDIIQKPIE